jgi:protein involved in polysaccharide export with SLBB domain
VDVVVLRRVTVLGSVRSPNVFYVDATTTLRDVVARAGGVDQYGDSRKVTLVRNGTAREIPDWDKATGFGQIQSGDQIIVGRKNCLAMNGVQVAGLGVAIISLVLTLTR